MATLLGRRVPLRIFPKLISPCYSRLASTARFNWEDSLSVKNLLTSEELDIQETARAYCQERLLPRILGNLNAFLRSFTLKTDWFHL